MNHTRMLRYLFSNSRFRLTKSLMTNTVNENTYGCEIRNFHSDTYSNESKLNPVKDFIVCFDIDGVFLSGSKLISKSKTALPLLDKHNIDYVFISNNCSQSEHDFAKHLSKLIEYQIDPKLLIMAHSPMRSHQSLHKKRILAVGYRNERLTMESVGFTNIVTVAELNEFYKVFLDFNEENKTPADIESIDAIILMEEPIAWESSIQLIIDIMVTGGQLGLLHRHTFEDVLAMKIKSPPIYALCSDFLTKNEAPWPRLSIGAFMSHLEDSFHKLTGSPLKYEAIYGKPNFSTYSYLQNYLNKIFDRNHKKMYFIGDNLLTDIYGANLYKDILLSDSNGCAPEIKTCFVHTGVHGKNWIHKQNVHDLLSLLHKTTPKINSEFIYPDFEGENVNSILNKIIEIEKLF